MNVEMIYKILETRDKNIMRLKKELAEKEKVIQWQEQELREKEILVHQHLLEQQTKKDQIISPPKGKVKIIDAVMAFFSSK